MAKNNTLSRKLKAAVGRCVIQPPKNRSDANTLRLYFSVSWLAITGSLVLAFFSIAAYRSENHHLAMFLLAICLINAANYVFLKMSHNVALATKFSAGLMILCFGYLLLTGGMGNTGLYWCFVFSPLLFFFLGHRQGIQVCALLTAVSFVVLFTPEFPLLLAEYPEAVKKRFPIIFGVISLLLFIQELSRYRVDRHNKMLTEKLQTVARTDDLTGLLNRRGAEEVLRREAARSLRKQYHYSLVLADIDMFKSINDQYGHDVGDETIKAISKAIQSTVRDNDYVARWGGEEFLIILIDANPNSGVEIAERIRSAVNGLSINCGAQAITTSLSLGVARFNEQEDVASVLKRADIALYQAKESGRNCVINGDSREAGPLVSQTK